MSCALGMPGLHHLFQCRLLDFATAHDDYITINLHFRQRKDFCLEKASGIIALHITKIIKCQFLQVLEEGLTEGRPFICFVPVLIRSKLRSQSNFKFFQ